jgi:hypothetical protein
MHAPESTILPPGVLEGEIMLFEKDIMNALTVDKESGYFIINDKGDLNFSYWRKMNEFGKLAITELGSDTSIYNSIHEAPKNLVAHAIGYISYRIIKGQLRTEFVRPLEWNQIQYFGEISPVKRFAIERAKLQMREIEYGLDAVTNEKILTEFAQRLFKVAAWLKKAIDNEPMETE